MNYLAHLHLGGTQPAELLGSLFGDFVKGPLRGFYPPEIEAAIRLHRKIDSFTDLHPITLNAKRRFPESRRRYAGILLDIFFDHCLAMHWSQFSAEPLADFTQHVYGVLQASPDLPGRLAHMAPLMAAQDWLGSYHDFQVLAQVIMGMQRRLSRPEGLHGSMAELEMLYADLEQDFLLFYPELMHFAASTRQAA
ncbi:MAG: ACP phosphodiesterase [Moraxellaceae bacterium]